MASATITMNQVAAELERATRKFPTWPTDPLHALAVLSEEYGELAKAMLQLTYEPHKTSPEEVRAEAIQTAAMALRLAMSLDDYEYRPTQQHSQHIEMAQCHKAIEIADESMFELLSSHCQGIPEPDESLIPVDEDGNKVELVDLACSAILDAVEWLKPRGYVDVVAGPNGAEGILVLRRPY